MVNKCCVPGCQSGYGTQGVDPSVSFHTFPKAPDLLAKWIRAIPRDTTC